MSIEYKIFDDSGLTALTDHIKETRAKAVSNEAALGALGEDLAGLSEATVAALADKQDKLTFYVTTEGDGVIYAATVPHITELTAGASFMMVPNVTSTTQTPTLNVNGLGAKTIRQRLSSNTSATVVGASANWVVAGKPVIVTYNGTDWVAEFTRPDANSLYGTVAIEKGGTGATDAAGARATLDVYSTSEVDAVINEKIEAINIPEHAAATVVLPASGWNDNTQTVSVPGVTANNAVMVGPAVVSRDEYAESDIVCTSQSDGALTFECAAVPTVDITVNVLIMVSGPVDVDLSSKQDIIVGTAGQFVVIGDDGRVTTKTIANAEEGAF